MAVSPLPQAPYRQDRKVFVTPIIGDVLFSEVRDCSRVEIPAYGTPHPNAKKWPSHKLAFVKTVDIERDCLFEFFYVADREDQDLYNWEFSKASIGGQLFDAVKRTYVVARDSFLSATPASGSPMPNTPKELFSTAGSYVLSDRDQVRIGDKELDSLYVSEVRLYILKTTQRQLDYDEQFGGNLTAVQTLYYATEVVTGTTTAKALFEDQANAYWGLQQSGVVREGKQLSSNWYAITERQVVSSSFALNGRTYTTTVDFSWPADLGGIAVDTWNRKDGGFENYVRPIYTKDAYSGPCRAVVTESFHVSVPTVEQPEVLQPLPINISNPLFSVSVGATLHAASTVSVSTGTEHPVYVYTAGNYPIQATTPTSRPSSLLASDSVQPFRGGFIRKQVRVFAPQYQSTP
jgi:hypothetical protein